MQCGTSTRRTAPTFTAVSTFCRSGQPSPTKTRARRSENTSAPPTAARSSSSDPPPRASTSSQRALSGPRLEPGDEVLISAMEHHSNIVPWQMLCEERGATLKVIPIDDNGDILLDEYEKLLSERTKNRRHRPHFQRPRHHQSGQGNDCDGPLPRRAGFGGRSAGGAPPGSRCPGPRLRLLRLFGPQGLWPDRHRRALR